MFACLCVVSVLCGLDLLKVHSNTPKQGLYFKKKSHTHLRPYKYSSFVYNLSFYSSYYCY